MNAIITPEFSIGAFEASDINPDFFNHEAHVYVGWLYVREYELAEAIAKFDAGLKRLITKLGADGKYHATLTWFFLLLIAERVETDEPWQIFMTRNADLVTDSKGILARYYSHDYLFSDRARETFLLPDRIANDQA